MMLAALASGCTNNNLPDYTTLGGLRVLTLVADQPEANPGATVNLTPVLSDLGGGGRALTFSVQACIDPGVGVGATAACASPDASNTQTGAVTPPAGSSQTYTGPVASFAITLPATDAVFTGRSAADQFNGVAYLVFYAISAPDGTSVNSLKRIVISSPTKTEKNQNPTLAGVTLAGANAAISIAGAGSADTQAFPSGVAALAASLPATSAETYSVQQADGSTQTQTETLVNTWFISDGAADYYRTEGATSDNWTPPTPLPSGRGGVILVVTRDGRGGETFGKMEFQ
jgi:hypothetical protein